MSFAEHRRTVVITGLSDSIDGLDIELYFQNRYENLRGDIERVSMAGHGRAQVVFEDVQDAHIVAAGRHTLKGAVVKTELLEPLVQPSAPPGRPYGTNTVGQKSPPTANPPETWDTAYDSLARYPSDRDRLGQSKSPAHYQENDTQRQSSQGSTKSSLWPSLGSPSETSPSSSHSLGKMPGSPGHTYAEPSRNGSYGSFQPSTDISNISDSLLVHPDYVSTASQSHSLKPHHPSASSSLDFQPTLPVPGASGLVMEQLPSSGDTAGFTLIVSAAAGSRLPDVDSLELYFESRKKSGGGDVENMQELPDGSMRITFCHYGVVERVLSQKKHILTGVELKMSLPEVEAIPEPAVSILVSELPGDIDEEILEMYFDSKKRSGGSGVEEVNMRADGTAIITFGSPEVAAAVCGQSHTLKKCPIVVELWVPGKEPSAEPTGERCLVVSDIPNVVHDEELEMYFESKKKSGGGEITELVYNNVDGTATVVFESHDTLERVLERAHKLRGVSLSVSSGFKGGQWQQQQGKASSSLASGAGTSKYESTMVILLNIPSTANVELVKFFMKAAVPDDGDLIIKSYPENSRALITFSKPFDFDQLDKFVTMEKLHGEDVAVRRVLRSSRLRVKNIDEFGDSCDDLIKFMLKATMRIDVSVDTRHGVFDIDFPSPEVAQKALATSHSLKDKTLDLYPVVAGLDYPAEEDDQQGFTGHVSATQPVELPMDPDYLLLLHRCSSIRRDFVAALAKEHAQVQSFEVSAPCLIVEPADGKTGRFGWHKTINSLASEFLETLGKEKLTMLSDLYADITDSDVLQSMLARYSQDIVYAPCSSDHTLTLIGRIRAVKGACDAVQQKMVEVEKSMREQVSEPVKLRPHVSAFFMHLNVLTKLREDQKHIEAQMQNSGKNKGSITLSGSRTEVNAVIQKLMTLQQQVFEKDLVIPDHNIANLLASDSGQEYLSGVMAAEELEGIMFVGKPSGNKPPAMWIVGWSNKEQELLGVKSKLEEECLAETMQLLPHEAEATQQPPWQDLLAEVKKQHLLVAVEVKGSGKDCCIVLHGIAPHNAVVQGEIIAYLSENAILAKFLKVSSGQERFINAYLKSDIKDIKQKYSLPFVDVRDGRMSFRGNTKNAEAGEKAFTSLLRAIVSDELSIDKPGINHVFSRSDTRKALKAIETEHRVVIEMGDESFDMEGETGTYGASEVIVTATTNAGLKVKVVKGDITQHPCDAAVNAANDEMKHIGGLALAFLRAGGKSIQDECDKYRQQYGKLPAGDAFCGSAGSLKCKWLIHAVGPNYRGGSAREETTLASAVSRSLEEAMKKGCATVAIPAISTGVFGYPLEDAVQTILQAAVVFFNGAKTVCIKEVHFVDMDDKVVNTFKKLIVENFAPDQVHLPIPEGSGRISLPPRESVSLRDAAAGVGRGGGKKKTRSRKRRGGGAGGGVARGGAFGSSQHTQAPKFAPPASGVSQVTTPERKTIVVRQGDLCKEQADVLVNTTASNLKLNNGMVSKVLSTAAGPGMQAECTTFVQTYGDVQVGRFAATGGHNLPCRHVYHCVGGPYNSGQGLQDLQDMVLRCLEEANKQGLRSIVFPSLGTGNLGFPPVESARLMFAAALDFSKRYPGGSLTEIRFAIFDQTILSQFHAEAARHMLPAADEVLELPPNPPPVQTANPSADAEFSDPVYIQQRGDILCGTAGNSSLQVFLLKGDITRETNSDAVVVSVQDTLDMKAGAVSSKIAEAAGNKCRQECAAISKKSGRLPPGAVAVVDGGRFVKNILLAVCPSSHAGQDALAATVQRALEEAEKCQASTVSFPAMGTGILGYQHSVSAEAMLTAISNFAPTARYVKQIRLILFDDASMDPFQQEFNEVLFNITLAHDSSGDGFLSRAVNFLGLSSRPNPQAPSTATSSTGVAQKAEGPVVLAIYGKTQASVRAVKEEVSSFCKDRYQSVEVKKSGIGQMNDSDHARLIQLMERFPVHVKVTGNCITISGDTMSVASVRGEVLEITVEASERQRREQHAMHISKLATWKYQTIGTTISKEYDLLVNADIEDAYQLYDQQVLGASTKVRIPGGNRWEIDFPTMKELHADGLYASVERIDHNKKEAIPPHWDKSKVSGDLFLLQPTDLEYQKVEQLFRKSSQRTIVKIERIQNEGLYLQYVAKKDAMEKKSPGKSNELQLFHGTDNTTAQKILSQGFNRSFAGKNATVYGRGVYFAVNARYSEGYSSGNPLQMFQCLVLTGEYAQGSQNIVAPPVRSGVDLYDSTVDNIGGPTIYVTYHDAQTYPEHLITFQ